MEDKTRLGRLLVEANLLTEEQLKMAADFQKTVGGNLGAIVVKLGFIEDLKLTMFIARQLGLHIVELEELILPQNLVKRIPRKLIEKHQILPIHYKDGILTIATSDPFDYEAIEELQLAQDAKIEVQLAPRSAIQRAIDELFRRPEPPAGPAHKEKSKDDLLRDLEGGSPRRADRPVSRMFLHEALIPLLLQKGVIREDELTRKAQELETSGKPVDKMGRLHLQEALIPLLIQKGLISEEELVKRARELEMSSARR